MKLVNGSSENLLLLAEVWPDTFVFTYTCPLYLSKIHLRIQFIDTLKILYY